MSRLTRKFIRQGRSRNMQAIPKATAKAIRRRFGGFLGTGAS